MPTAFCNIPGTQQPPDQYHFPLREDEIAGFLSPGATCPRFIASDINQGFISHIPEIIEL
jgi:hypothetical protein